MYLPNQLELLSLLPVLPILAKDLFKRPQVEYETPETYPGQQGLGGTAIKDFLKLLSARFGGEGMRPSTFKGAESVTNFQPYERTGGAAGPSTSPGIDFGGLGGAIQRTMQQQAAGRDREDRVRPDRTALGPDTTPREIATTEPERRFMDTYKTGPEDMNIGVEDRIVRDILDQLDGKRTPGGGE
jgi:hypothetical protein